MGKNYGVSSRLKAALHFKVLFCTLQLHLQENYCKTHRAGEADSPTIRVLKFKSTELGGFFFLRNTILNSKKFRTPKQSLGFPFNL